MTKIEPGMALAPNGMVVKGKARDVMKMLADLEATHGPDATIQDVYRNTMNAILHPVVPVGVPIEEDNE